MKNESIDKIEKAVENILPTSSAFINELDYSVIERKKADWLKLSELTHSIVLVFDCCTKKFVFVSNNIPQSYGIDSERLFINGHEPVLEIIHPGDIYYGLLVRKKIYSLLSSLSAEEKMKQLESQVESNSKDPRCCKLNIPKELSSLLDNLTAVKQQIGD